MWQQCESYSKFQALPYRTFNIPIINTTVFVSRVVVHSVIPTQQYTVWEFQEFHQLHSQGKICIIVRGFGCGLGQCVYLSGFRGMTVLTKGREFLTHPGNLYL